MIRRLDHYDVFLSFSRVDEQRVEELAIGLRDHALKTRTWVDFRQGLGDEATLITMPADFLESALAFPELRDILQGRQYLLGEIADADLLKVIAEPAREVGAFFENALPARIIDHFRENRGALALLEDALFELWRRRRGVWLTN
jgi:hypothetical protein